MTVPRGSMCPAAMDSVNGAPPHVAVVSTIRCEASTSTDARPFGHVRECFIPERMCIPSLCDIRELPLSSLCAPRMRWTGRADNNNECRSSFQLWWSSGGGQDAHAREYSSSRHGCARFCIASPPTGADLMARQRTDARHMYALCRMR